MTASEERARRWRGFLPWALLAVLALHLRYGGEEAAGRPQEGDVSLDAVADRLVGLLGGEAQRTNKVPRPNLREAERN